MITAANFSSALVLVLVGAIILWIDPPRRVNRWMFAASLHLALWLGLCGMVGAGNDPVFWIRLSASVAALLVLTLWFVKESLLREGVSLKRRRWVEVVLSIVAITLASAPLTPAFIPPESTSALRLFGWGYYAYFAGGALACIGLLLDFYLTDLSKPQERPLGAHVWMAGGVSAAAVFFALMWAQSLGRTPILMVLQAFLVAVIFSIVAFSVALPRLGAHQGRILRGLYLFAGLNVILALSLLAEAFYVRFTRSHLLASYEQTIAAINREREGAISRWLTERRLNISRLVDSPRFAEHFAEVVRSINPTEDQLLHLDWISSLATSRGFTSVVALGPGLKPLAGQGIPPDFMPADTLGAAIRTGRTAAWGIELAPRLGADGVAIAEIVTPIRRASTSEAVGYLLFRLDIAGLIQETLVAWAQHPGSPDSALWWNRGDEWFSLGDSGRDPRGERVEDLAQYLKARGLSSLVASGSTRMAEAEDAEGRAVFGLGKRIRDSDWLITTRRAREEVLAPLRGSAWVPAGATAGVLLVISGVVGQALSLRRARIDRAHAQALARLGVFLQSANDAAILFSPSQRIIAVNHRAQEFYQRTERELLELSEPDLLAAGACAPPCGDGQVCEGLHRRKDGSLFPVEISARWVEMDGAPHRFVLIRDITERKQLQGQVSDLARRLEAVLEHAPVGVALADEHSVTVNPEHVRITGVKEIDASTKGAYDLASHPSDVALKRDLAADYAAGMTDAFAMEKRYRRPGGGWTWARMTTRRMIDPVTGARMSLTTLTDITALKEAEERYRTIFEASRDGILLLRGPEWRFVTGNSAAVTLFGMESSEQLSAVMPWVLSPATQPDGRTSEDKAREVIAQALQTGSQDFEWMHQAVDGRNFLCAIHLQTVEIGDESCLIVVIRDITEQRAAEAALRQNEARYRRIFDQSPAAIWEEDFSAVRERVRQLKEEGVTDLARFLAEHPSETKALASKVKVLAINQRGRDLMNLPAGLPTDIGDYLDESGLRTFAEEVAALDRGESTFSAELPLQRHGGAVLWGSMTVAVPDGYRDSWALVLFSILDITDLKKAEQALRESEQTLLEAQGIARVGSLAYDHHTDCWTSSPELDRIFGVSPEYDRTMAGWLRLVHPDDRDGMAAYYATEVVGQGRPFDREYRIQRASDQSVRWVHGRAVLDRDHTGAPTNLRGAIQDITERKLAEQARADEQTRIRTIIDTVDAPLFVKDNEHRIILANRAFCQLFGVDAQEVIGRTLAEHVTPEERVAFMAADRHVLDTGEASVREETLTTGGKTLNIITHKARFVEQSGQRFLVGFLHDITAIRAAEEALRTSRTLLSAVNEGTPDCIFIKDLDGRYLLVNTATARFLGKPRSEVLGKDDTQLFPEAEARMLRAVDARILAEGRVQTFEETLTSAEGRVVTFLSTKGPVRDPTGRVTGSFGVVRDITERKKEEDQLRRLSRVVEQSPMAIVLTSPSGAIEYANPAFCASTGYGLDEMVGRNPRILKSGFTAPEVYANMWKTLGAGEVWRGQLINRRKDGSLFTEFCVIAPVLGEHGRPVAYAAIKEDITERLAVARALHESEERFRELFELETDAIMVIDVGTGRIVLANPAAATMYGASMESLLQIESSSLSADPKIKQADFLLLDPEHQGTGRQSLRYHRRLDGTVFPVDVALRGFNRDGRRMVVAVVRDITEQVKAREQLEQFATALEAKVMERTAELAASNRANTGLLQAIPDLVVHLRADGTVLRREAPEAAGALLPLARELTADARSPGAEAFREAKLDIARRALSGQGLVTRELRLGPGEGGLVIELRAAPIGSDEVVVFARDITQRHLAEENMARALEKEKEMSQMKSRFIAVTSHEFRTPMSAATSAAELLLSHADRLSPARRQAMLARIDQSLRRMSDMLDDLLTYNRASSGRLPVKLASVDLLGLVEGVVADIRLIDTLRHRFSIQSTGDCSRVSSDREILLHLVTNLLDNAVRYSPAGTLVTVRILATPGHFSLVVEDQGIGIPSSDLDRIMKPFERGSNTTGIEGSGLGLSIVGELLDILGGTCAIASEEGKGTRFTLHFPQPPPLRK